MRIIYTIWDPTGNVTALVERAAAADQAQEIAASIMARHPEVEQVGFVSCPIKDQEVPYDQGVATADGRPEVQAALRMAGGEFCGNAALSAAAWYVRKQGMQADGVAASVSLRVSGTKDPVRVDLACEGADRYSGLVHMPRIRDIKKHVFTDRPLKETLPVVTMDGISHVIIDSDKSFYALRRDKAKAETVIRHWCRYLQAEALGIMFIHGYSLQYKLTPLVYVPGSHTCYWENSCASGSAAAGFYLAKKHGHNREFDFRQPGGTLTVSCDTANEIVLLRGRTSYVGAYDLSE